MVLQTQQLRHKFYIYFSKLYFCDLHKNIKFEKNQNLSNCPSKRIVDSVYINNKYFGDLNSYREHIESSDFIEEEKSMHQLMYEFATKNGTTITIG